MSGQIETRDISKDIFGSKYRLEIWHAVLETAPKPREDVFSQIQIARIVGIDSTYTHREFIIMEDKDMIDYLGWSTGNGKKFKEYVREDSGLWRVATTALEVCGVSIEANDIKRLS